MPTYIFRNKKTNRTSKPKLMAIAEMEKYISDNPHMETAITPLNIVSGISTRIKPDKGFRELLSKIGKKSGKKVNDFGG